MAPGKFEVTDFAQYQTACAEHFVIPDPAQRKAIIRTEIEKLATAAGGRVLPDEELLEQVSYNFV